MKYSIRFFSLFFLILMNLEAYGTRFYLLSYHNNKEAHNQALGILAAFKKVSHTESPVEDLNVNLVTPEEIKQRVEQDLTQEKVIVVGAGEGGIEGIKDLSPNPRLTICLASRIILEKYMDPKLIEKVNYIALPAPIPPQIKSQLGSKLIETQSTTSEVSENAYTMWGKKELPDCKTYVGVVLGEDTPTPTKGIKLFTEEDASKLANYVSQNHKGACVLILNVPQTEKHDFAKHEIPWVHQQGVSDHITEMFKNKLIASGQKNIKVFNFQHPGQERSAEAPAYNTFSLVTGAVKATNGHMIVPGQALSIISKTADALPSGNVLVYLNNAMTKEHEAQVARELAAGRISVLENYKKITRPSINHRSLRPSSPPAPNLSMAVAQKLWESVSH